MHQHISKSLGALRCILPNCFPIRFVMFSCVSAVFWPFSSCSYALSLSKCVRHFVSMEKCFWCANVTLLLTVSITKGDWRDFSDFGDFGQPSATYGDFGPFRWFFGVKLIWGIETLESVEISGFRAFHSQMIPSKGDAQGRGRNERGRARTSEDVRGTQTKRARTCEEIRRNERGRARNERGWARTSEDFHKTAALGQIALNWPRSHRITPKRAKVARIAQISTKSPWSGPSPIKAPKPSAWRLRRPKLDQIALKLANPFKPPKIILKSPKPRRTRPNHFKFVHSLLKLFQSPGDAAAGTRRIPYTPSWLAFLRA